MATENLNAIQRYRAAVEVGAQAAAHAWANDQPECPTEKMAREVERRALADIRKDLDVIGQCLEVMADLLDDRCTEEPDDHAKAFALAARALDRLGSPLPCIREERERKRAEEAYRAVGEMLRKHLPGGIVLDLRASGALPVVKCGPFRDRQGVWAVVQVNGRREVRALDPDQAVIVSGSANGQPVDGVAFARMA